MIHFVFRRFLRALGLLAAVSVFCFVLFAISPGDYFLEARLDPAVSASTLEQLRETHGLNRSWLSRYLSWFWSLLRGDWGWSLAYGTPVGPMLRERAANTLLLTAVAAILSWLLAIPIAVHTAWIGGTLARFARSLVALLNSIPDLLIALLLLWFAAKSGMFPIGGMTSIGLSQQGLWSGAYDTAWHMAMPVLALVLTTTPILLVHGIAATAEVVDSSFINAARAHGIPRHRVLYRHALPVAANSLISLFGLTIGSLLSSSLLIEVAMGWPGIGSLLFNATMQRDPHVVAGAIMLSACFIVAGNLIADTLLYLNDPRIRDL